MDKRKTYAQWHDTMCAVDQSHRELQAASQCGEEILPSAFKVELARILADLETFRDDVRNTCYQVRDSQKKTKNRA